MRWGRIGLVTGASALFPSLDVAGPVLKPERAM